MAGTLTISTLSDGTNSTSATNCIQGSAKAWVRFNGVTTVTINGSYNVSSVTRGAAGLYTINFTNAMTDANYSACGSVPLMGTNSGVISVFTNGSGYLAPTTSSFSVLTYIPGSGSSDSQAVSISVFR